MPRTNRYTNSSNIVTAPQNVPDGFGSLKRATGATVVADYKFSHFFPRPFQRTKLIEQYALTENSIIKYINGDYSALIKAGMFIVVDSDTYKLLGVSPVQGGATTYKALAMVAMKIQGTA